MNLPWDNIADPSNREYASSRQCKGRNSVSFSDSNSMVPKYGINKMKQKKKTCNNYTVNSVPTTKCQANRAILQRIDNKLIHNETVAKVLLF